MLLWNPLRLHSIFREMYGVGVATSGKGKGRVAGPPPAPPPPSATTGAATTTGGTLQVPSKVARQTQQQQPPGAGTRRIDGFETK